MPAWLIFLLTTGGAVGVEQIIRAMGKSPEKAMEKYASKQAYSKKRAMGMLSESEGLRGKSSEIGRKVTGDPETMDILQQSLMLSQSEPERGAALGDAMGLTADMGDPSQIEAALSMMAGEQDFSARIRQGSQLPQAPLLSLMGVA